MQGNPCGFQKLETDSALEPAEGTWPANTLILAQRDPSQPPDLQNRQGIRLC